MWLNDETIYVNIINLLAVASPGSTGIILQFHPGPEIGCVLLPI